MEHQANNAKGRDYEIDLKFFYTVFRKCWYWVALAAILLGLLVGVYSSAFIEKMYSSTVYMYVDPRAQSSSSSFNSSTAEALAATYPPVIRQADVFAKKVALEMALLTKEDGTQLFPSWTYETVGEVKTAKNWGRVRGMMNTGIKDDKIFYITIRSANPEEAYRMAEIAAWVAPEILNEIVGVGKVEAIGYPVLDTTPDSPNVMRNALVAAVVAAVLLYAIFFLVYLFDTTIYIEQDLARFGLPLLGVVPTFPAEEGERDRRASKEVQKK